MKLNILIYNGKIFTSHQKTKALPKNNLIQNGKIAVISFSPFSTLAITLLFTGIIFSRCLYVPITKEWGIDFNNPFYSKICIIGFKA